MCPAGCFTEYNNTDLSSDGLVILGGIFNVSQAANQCAALCLSIAACTSFAYSQALQTCYLGSDNFGDGINHLTANIPGVTAFVRDSSEPGACPTPRLPVHLCYFALVCIAYLGCLFMCGSVASQA